MGINMYDVYIPDLDSYVKFKVLAPEDTESFKQCTDPTDETNYKKLVLENFIFNLRTEVLETVRTLEPDKSEKVLDALFNCCVQLNPALDIDTWVDLAFSKYSIFMSMDLMPPQLPAGISEGIEELSSTEYAYKKIKPYKLTKAKYSSMSKVLRSSVIGQEEAIIAVEGVLKRSQAGLSDNQRPIGVLMFAGASGTGKTLLAKTLQSHLFGTENDIIRLDCGELQHKHENQKIIGAPPGYLGHDNGGVLTNAVMKNPYSVVLIDEVEKAHPDIFNTFLRICDEGLVTDSKGTVVSFRNCVIIMTTNLGNKVISEEIQSSGFGFTRIAPGANPKREAVVRKTEEAVQKHFTPEFLNRIDDVIVFNHLTNEDFRSIADLEIQKVDEKLTKKGISLACDDSVVEGLIELGVDHIKGARGMERVRRDKIENVLADIILSGKIPRGTLFNLTYKNGIFCVDVSKPVKKAETS